MDRRIVYVGQIPIVDDILLSELHAYIGLAKLAAAVLGTTTQINGFTCIATSPASMNVVVTPGEIYQLEAIDVTAYGDLPTNSTQILKQGINLANSTNLPCPAPSTSGYSINYLIEIGWATVDGGSTLLPFYNAANPSQAFSGANNDALPNMTTRQDYASIQVKAGTAATTGMQTTPSPDTGYVGAFVVTVAQGQTTITSSSISQYPGAPFIPDTLDNIVTIAALQSGQYLTGVSTSAANTYTTALTPAITSLSKGCVYCIGFTNANTAAASLNPNGIGATNIKRLDGTALKAGDIQANMMALFSFDGTNLQLLNRYEPLEIQRGAATYATSTTAANTYTTTLTPVPVALIAGMNINIAFTNGNTGAVTLNPNGLGASAIVTTAGAALVSGQIAANMVADLTYLGSSWQLNNPAFDNLALQKANNLSDLASIPTAKSNLIISPAYKSSSYALLTTDESISFTAVATATLPTAVGVAGKIYNILNSATTNVNVTIATTSSQTIGGRASSNIILTTFGDWITVISDGTNWIILSKQETTYVSANSSGTSVNGADGSYQNGGAGLTLGIGNWRTRMYGYMNTGTSSAGCSFSYGTGFYSVNGANNSTPPTAVPNIIGTSSYNSISAGGTYAPMTPQSNTGNYILFPIEAEIIVPSSTQNVFAVAQLSYVTSTNFIWNTFIEAWRIY